MIYNLMQYIENELNYNIYINPRDIIYPNNEPLESYIQIIETGGSPDAYIGDTNKTIQILCVDKDSPKARRKAENIFNLLNDRFGLILNAITVDGVYYPSIQISQISANTEPQFIGYNQNKLAEFSINFRILFRR
jgi:hypothetical protein